jgi:hypothetical protein
VPVDFQDDIRAAMYKRGHREPTLRDLATISSNEFIQYFGKRQVWDRSIDICSDPELDSPSSAGPSSAGSKRSATSNIGPEVGKKSRTSEHPIWDQLIARVDEKQTPGSEKSNSNATLPAGLSLTRLELIKDLASDNENIWTASLYFHLQSTLIRDLYRVNLRPIGEQKYKDSRARKAKEKKEEMAQRILSKKPAVRKKAYERSLKSLLEQLDQAISSCDITWSGPVLTLQDPVDTLPEKSRVARTKRVLDMIRVNINKLGKVNNEIKNIKIDAMKVDVKVESNGTDMAIDDGSLSVISDDDDNNDDDLNEDDLVYDLIDGYDGFQALVDLQDEGSSEASGKQIENPQHESSSESMPQRKGIPVNSAISLLTVTLLTKKIRLSSLHLSDNRANIKATQGISGSDMSVSEQARLRGFPSGLQEGSPRSQEILG